eukprot:COSAG01_NODE_19215_length_1024_cov_0.944865_2_plen_139_part_00
MATSATQRPRPTAAPVVDASPNWHAVRRRFGVSSQFWLLVMLVLAEAEMATSAGRTEVRVELSPLQAAARMGDVARVQALVAEAKAACAARRLSAVAAQRCNQAAAEGSGAGALARGAHSYHTCRATQSVCLLLAGTF